MYLRLNPATIVSIARQVELSRIVLQRVEDVSWNESGFYQGSHQEVPMPATAHVLNDRAVDLSHLFLKQKEDVHSTVLDGESVLLNLSTGRYYTLNIVGSIVWDLSTGDRSLAQVVSTICEKFDVTAQQAQDDLLDLVGELGQEGLIYTERR